MTINVKQRLLTLRTANPAVVTKGFAEECSWAADTIELMARVIGGSRCLDMQTALIQDYRLYELVKAVGDDK